MHLTNAGCEALAEYIVTAESGYVRALLLRAYRLFTAVRRDMKKNGGVVKAAPPFHIRFGFRALVKGRK